MVSSEQGGRDLEHETAVLGAKAENVAVIVVQAVRELAPVK
jgi:hypothetical protein